MKFLEWLWSLLPDKCQICKGRHGGVRGNENRIMMGTKQLVVCDYCHSNLTSYKSDIDKRSKIVIQKMVAAQKMLDALQRSKQDENSTI